MAGERRRLSRRVLARAELLFGSRARRGGRADSGLWQHAAPPVHVVAPAACPASGSMACPRPPALLAAAAVSRRVVLCRSKRGATG